MIWRVVFRFIRWLILDVSCNVTLSRIPRDQFPFQIPPSSTDRIATNRMCFSEAGEFLVVPVSRNEYNAYSLTGGSHKIPLVKEDGAFSVTSYFEKPEIVYEHGNFIGQTENGPYFKSFRGDRVGPIALCKRWRRPVCKRRRWACRAAGFEREAPALFDEKFIVDFNRKRWSSSINYSDNSIVCVRTPRGATKGPDDYFVFSSPYVQQLATFRGANNVDHAWVTKHALDENSRRLFMTQYTKSTDDFYNFQIVDLKTGETLFGLKERGEQDFDVKANCVISYDRERLKIYVRDHPEWWWGHFYRVETC